jgi:hypothetical protein
MKGTHSLNATIPEQYNGRQKAMPSTVTVMLTNPPFCL